MPESSNCSKTNRTKIQLVSSTLTGLSKSELTNRDIFGRTILHILILANRYDLLRNLLKNPDVKLLLTYTDYENGWNCLHYVIFHKRLSCYKVLIDYVQNLKAGSVSNTGNNLLIEMLRCKDRNKVTPLQLLDNDFKDLVWIPEYIDENNEYHLSYRFQRTKRPNDDGEDENEERNRQFIHKRLFVRQKHNWSNPRRGGSDIYMFGSNKNNNLGVGDATDRAIPTKISHECFKSKENLNQSIQANLMKPRYRMIKISKNHSIVLTYDGSLYSCGIGSRGRLGHGFDNLNNTFRFRKINFFEPDEDEENELGHTEQVIKDIAISSNHNIALSDNNEVYSWGLNNFNQLGYTSSIASSSNSVSHKTFLEPFEGLPKEIITGDLKRNQNLIIGVGVSKIHSVAYTKNELFFWGLCIGQMGIPMDGITSPIEHRVDNITYKGFIQRSPRKVALRDDIKYVQTSETCTCVITTTNDIHIFYQYQHFKLPKIPVKGSIDKHFDLFKPTKLTQAISIEKVCLKSHQFIALLLDNGDVMNFTLAQSDAGDGSSRGYKNLKYSSLWKSYDRDMKVIDIDVSNDGSIILCTRNGSAFIKTHSSQRKNSMSEVSLSIPTAKNKFKRVENLNKVIKVSCDDNFLSFGFIRDEIDLLPFELQSNDFLQDMEYLSFLTDTDFFRKQKQLLNVDHNHSFYISDYLYSQNTKTLVDTSYHSRFPGHPQEDEEELDEISTKTSNEDNKQINDVLYDRYISRYDFQKNRRIKPKSTYLHTSCAEDETFMNLLKSDMLYLSYKLNENSESNKRHNCRIKFEKFPDISISIHKEIFMKRSPFCAKIFNPKNEGEYFIEEGVEGRYNPETNELIFTSNINIKSVLIISHFIYSNRVLSIWDDFPGGLNCPPDIKEIRLDFDKLARLFLMTDLLGKFTKDEVFLKKVQGLVNDKQSGDVIIRLKDGDIMCHSYILIARSAFFETVLSKRWDNEEDNNNDSKILTLDDVSVLQFDIILRYLYGCNDMELFDYLNEKFGDTPDIDEFINFLLELIEISDELLLLQLKSLCQLGIKDFISLENVLIILTHAHYLGATKLFMNCCWFIYNNLDAILFDPSFREILDDLLKELEEQILFFQNCKLIDFTEDPEKRSDNTLKHWMELQSNSFIFQFLTSIKEHNEIFISDKRGFEGFDPLIDLKYADRKSTLDFPRKKKEGRSHSTASRKNSTISNIQANLVDFRKIAATKNNENEEALDDSEDIFEIVNNKRRQNSKSDSTRPASVLNSASSTPPPSRSSSRASSIIDDQSIQPTRKTSLAGSSSAKPLVVNKDTYNVGLSSHSNWATKPNEVIIDKQPVLGKGHEFQENDQLSLLQKKNGKIKFGPSIRLSQKERKKMASQINAENGNNEDIPKTLNPWTVKGSGTVATNSANGLNLPLLGSLIRSSKQEDNTRRKNSQSQAADTSGGISRPLKPNNDFSGKKPLQRSDLPKLGNANNQVKQDINQTKSTLYSSMTLNVKNPVNKVYSTPSLTEIMIHESLKIEEAKIKETERKTLQEIQQEQQFAKWWEEEALRVQRQMSQLEINGRDQPGSSSNHSNGTNKNKKNKNTKPKRLPSGNDDLALTPNNKTKGKYKNFTKE